MLRRDYIQWALLDLQVADVNVFNVGCILGPRWLQDHSEFEKYTCKGSLISSKFKIFTKKLLTLYISNSFSFQSIKKYGRIRYVFSHLIVKSHKKTGGTDSFNDVRLTKLGLIRS